MHHPHSALIALFIVGLGASVAAAQGQPEPAAGQETATTPAAADSAATDAAADGTAADTAAAAAAAAPAPSCDGMIDPAQLTDACDAKLRDDKAWRIGLGTELSSRIMCAVKNRKGRVVDASKDKDPCADVKIEPWLSEIAENLNHEVHQQELESIQQNNRHVIMAYSALWIVMIGFVAFMWTRQKQLKDEIAQLQTELTEATRDD